MKSLSKSILRTLTIMFIVVQISNVLAESTSKTESDPTNLTAKSANPVDKSEASQLRLLQDLDTEDMPDAQVRQKRFFGGLRIGFGGFDPYSRRYYGGGFRRGWRSGYYDSPYESYYRRHGWGWY